MAHTVKSLEIWTSEKCIVITLIVEQGSFTADYFLQKMQMEKLRVQNMIRLLLKSSLIMVCTVCSGLRISTLLAGCKRNVYISHVTRKPFYRVLPGKTETELCSNSELDS